MKMKFTWFFCILICLFQRIAFSKCGENENAGIGETTSEKNENAGIGEKKLKIDDHQILAKVKKYFKKSENIL